MSQPPAIIAKKTLDWAIRVGLARRWSCFDCGTPFPSSKPRFEDPSQPLKVRWYCDMCWRKDVKDRSLMRAKMEADAFSEHQTRSWGERVRMVLSDLEQAPTLKAELVQKVRQKLPVKLCDIGEDSPLFRQLLAREHFQI